MEKSGSGEVDIDDEDYNFEEGSATSPPLLLIIRPDESQGEGSGSQVYGDEDGAAGNSDNGSGSLYWKDEDPKMCRCSNDGKSTNNPEKLLLVLSVMSKLTLT